MPPCHPTANPQCQQSPEDSLCTQNGWHKEFNCVPGPETREQELPSRKQSLENEGDIVNNSFWPVGHLLPVWRCNLIDCCMTLFAFCSLQLILDIKKHATCTELVEVWKWICLSVIFYFAHPLYLSYFSACKCMPIVLTFFLLWPVGLYPAYPLKISCMPELTYHIFLLVKRLWRAKDTGRLEAAVGPYKLLDSSFRTLQGSRWFLMR